MTSAQDTQAAGQRRLAPADLHNVRFSRASMLRPGYADAEVDRVLSRVAEELGRLIAEKAELRDEVRALRSQVAGAIESQASQVPPSEQAVRILATAQQTADTYVAEAEEFSRQVTSEARAEYEELVREARENAGAIIQAAQEAAAKLGGGTPGAAGGDQRSVAELQEQVAYLKAFSQACRVQLRSYLEALLTDVETEWGRANPDALPPEMLAPPAQRSGRGATGGGATTFVSNTAQEVPQDDGSAAVAAGAGAERPG
jgi:DivIVA domain-containing protein